MIRVLLALLVGFAAPLSAQTQWRLTWIQPGVLMEEAQSYLYRIRWDEGPWIPLTHTCAPAGSDARCETVVPAPPVGTQTVTIYAESPFGDNSPWHTKRIRPEAPTDLRRVIVLELP